MASQETITARVKVTVSGDNDNESEIHEAVRTALVNCFGTLNGVATGFQAPVEVQVKVDDEVVLTARNEAQTNQVGEYDETNAPDASTDDTPPEGESAGEGNENAVAEGAETQDQGSAQG